MSELFDTISSPMLAPAKLPPLEGRDAEFILQPKLDGFRAWIHGGIAYNRKKEPLRNKFVQAWAAANADDLEGLDGELTVGPPNAPDVFAKSRTISRIEYEPDFQFNVFDIWDKPDTDASTRLEMLAEWLCEDSMIPRVVLVESYYLDEPGDIDKYESRCLEQGYEGAMLRHRSSLYKYGRGTPGQACLLKLKRFIDEEATVVGFEELMHNQNAPTIDATGHQTRSAHKEGMVAGGTLGALIVESEKWPQFKIGTGFDAAMRQQIWDSREYWLGKEVTFKYQAHGSEERPRMPVFIRERTEP